MYRYAPLYFRFLGFQTLVKMNYARISENLQLNAKITRPEESPDFVAYSSYIY